MFFLQPECLSFALAIMAFFPLICMFMHFFKNQLGVRFTFGSSGWTGCTGGDWSCTLLPAGKKTNAGH